MGSTSQPRPLNPIPGPWTPDPTLWAPMPPGAAELTGRAAAPVAEAAPPGAGPVAEAAPVAEAPPPEDPPPGAPPPGAAVVVAAPGRSAANLAFRIALALAVAGLAFAIGRLSAPATAAAAGDGVQRGIPGDGGFGRLDRGSAISGTVTAISSTSITVTLASGQTVEIPIDASTTYHQSTAATASAVTAGSTVTVRVAGGAPGGRGTRSEGTATDITVTTR